MAKVLKINHIAIAVPEINEALVFWQDALGLKLSHTEDVPSQKSKVGFVPISDSEVELVQPTTSDSGLAKYIEKRGPGLHHICLEVDNIEEMIAQLLEKGIHMIDETPNTLEGRKMAFIHPKSTGSVLVELYQLI
ncbi:MAG: methylmalonyl-CoA epimerase [Anaerolineaceae bacterium]|nr:methylmalonyl-CoA epimerase [Anaerolineaceae bacterium]